MYYSDISFKWQKRTAAPLENLQGTVASWRINLNSHNNSVPFINPGRCYTHTQTISLSIPPAHRTYILETFRYPAFGTYQSLN